MSAKSGTCVLWCVCVCVFVCVCVCMCVQCLQASIHLMHTDTTGPEHLYQPAVCSFIAGRCSTSYMKARHLLPCTLSTQTCLSTCRCVYPQFLTEASEAEDPAQRMALVMTWFVAGVCVRVCICVCVCVYACARACLPAKSKSRAT